MAKKTSILKPMMIGRRYTPSGTKVQTKDSRPTVNHDGQTHSVAYNDRREGYGPSPHAHMGTPTKGHMVGGKHVRGYVKG